LEDGSEQTHVWGADWYPLKQDAGYESLINIRPRVGNRSMEIQDAAIREQIHRIVQNLLGNVSWQ
jgi:hypothetical protein